MRIKLSNEPQSLIVTFLLGAFLAWLITWGVLTTVIQQNQLNDQKISECLFNAPTYMAYDQYGRKIIKITRSKDGEDVPDPYVLNEGVVNKCLNP